jgi:hypothetical protein
LTGKINFFNKTIKKIEIEAVMTQETIDWQELTRLTGGRSFVVERVRLIEPGVAIEGAFVPPQLAKLSAEDQVFVAAFVRSHGSIKDMEQMFGVSYPTVKARLNRIAASLEFIDTSPAPAKAEVLDRLSRGEITADEAISALEKRPSDTSP